MLVCIYVSSAISTRNIDEMQRFYYDRGCIPIRSSGNVILRSSLFWLLYIP